MSTQEPLHPRTPAGSPSGGQFAAKQGATEAHAALLGEHDNDSVRATSLRDYTTDPDTLDRALDDRSARVRAAAAFNSCARSSSIDKALNDVDEDVRASAASNPAASNKQLEQACSDSDDRVGRAASTALTDRLRTATLADRAIPPRTPERPVLHKEENVVKAMQGSRTLEGGETVIFAPDIGPADGREAAKRMLNTNHVQFAGIRHGYPSYEIRHGGTS